MCGCCGNKKEEEDLETQLPEQPVGGRKKVCCTDIPCLIFFILFTGGMVAVTVLAVMNGNINRLLYGYDCFGNTCNSPNAKVLENETMNGMDMSGKPYLYYFHIFYATEGLSVCVKKCPDRELQTIEDVRNFSMETGVNLCSYDFNSADLQFSNQSSKMGPCPKLPIMPHVSLLGRCIPGNLSSIETSTQRNIFGAVNRMDVFERVLKDFYVAYKELIVLCLIAAGFAFVMVLLIRFLAAVVIYLILIFFIIGCLAACTFMWWTFVNSYLAIQRKEKAKIPLLDTECNNEAAFLGLAIIGTVLTVVFVILISVIFKRLRFVKDLFGAAGRCITSAPLVLLQPIWTLLLLLVFFTYWVVVLAYIVTSGVPTRDPKSDRCYSFDQVGPLQYLWYYHLAALIWWSEFIVACQQLVVAGVVSRWYFSRKREDLPNCPVGKACSRTIVHHLGSAAFGSLIITLVKFPRWLLMWLKKKWTYSAGQNECCSPVSSFCLRCCICCLWCLECCLRYLTHNAYAVIMIRGSSFCPAAKRAFGILLSNSLRVAALNSVGDFVLFLGKVGVAVSTAAISVLILKTRDDLHFYMVPVVAVSVFAFFIAHCFLSVYETVLDVLLVCYCEDRRINDGSPGREYFMTTDLHRLMQKSSAQLTEATRPKVKRRPAADESDGMALTAPQEAAGGAAAEGEAAGDVVETAEEKWRSE